MVKGGKRKYLLTTRFQTYKYAQRVEKRGEKLRFPCWYCFPGILKNFQPDSGKLFLVFIIKNPIIYSHEFSAHAGCRRWAVLNYITL